MRTVRQAVICKIDPCVTQNILHTRKARTLKAARLRLRLPSWSRLPPRMRTTKTWFGKHPLATEVNAGMGFKVSILKQKDLSFLIIIELHSQAS